MANDAPTPSSGELHAEAHVRRLERALEQLDANIARLGQSLGLALDSPPDLREALRGESPAGRPHASPRHREEELRLRLRGLLTLRYELLRRCFDELGPDVTFGLIVEAEQQLEAQGFRAGADGLGVELLLRRATRDGA